MDREEKVLQEYILYVQHKENFVNRTFDANKFYLIITLVMLCVTVPVTLIPFASGVIFAMLFAVIGMGLCVLWIMNINAYKRLLKIKFKSVIEKMEDELPVKPYQLESQALKEDAEKRTGFMFGDMQRVLSIIIFITYIAVFVNEVILLLSSLHIFD